MREYSASGSNFVKRFFHRNRGNIYKGLQREVKGKLLKNKAARNIITPFYKTREPLKWLFLVGCYNSGTTILRDIISSHREVHDLPFEGVKLTGAFPDLEQGGWPRMMYKNKHLWSQQAEASSEIAKRAKRDWSPWWPREATIFLEKSIDQSTRIRWLANHFPSSHFIYIVRNGYCVSEGIMRRSKPTGHAIAEVGDTYPASLVAEQWVEFDRFIESEIDGLENVLRMKYEDLTEEPLSSIRSIYRFLELPEPEMEKKGDIVTVDKKTFSLKNQNRNSIERITDRNATIMTSVMKSTLVKYNYEII